VIGDREVVAVIKNKQTANKEYDEAKKAGKGVIFAERVTKKHTEWLKIKLGNIAPKGDAVITIKLIETATEMIGGAYSYTVPSKYFPRYSVVGDRTYVPYPEWDPNRYNF
jgi:hypothetical protein